MAPLLSLICFILLSGGLTSRGVEANRQPYARSRGYHSSYPSPVGYVGRCKDNDDCQDAGCVCDGNVEMGSTTRKIKPSCSVTNVCECVGTASSATVTTQCCYNTSVNTYPPSPPPYYSSSPPYYPSSPPYYTSSPPPYAVYTPPVYAPPPMYAPAPIYAPAPMYAPPPMYAPAPIYAPAPMYAPPPMYTPPPQYTPPPPMYAPPPPYPGGRKKRGTRGYKHHRPYGYNMTTPYAGEFGPNAYIGSCNSNDDCRQTCGCSGKLVDSSNSLTSTMKPICDKGGNCACAAQTKQGSTVTASAMEQCCYYLTDKPYAPAPYSG